MGVSRTTDNMLIGNQPRLCFKRYVEIIFFYIHGSVHRESHLITVQQDATYTVYYISVGSSTCFGY